MLSRQSPCFLDCVKGASTSTCQKINVWLHPFPPQTSIFLDVPMPVSDPPNISHLGRCNSLSPLFSSPRPLNPFCIAVRVEYLNGQSDHITLAHISWLWLRRHSPTWFVLPGFCHLLSSHSGLTVLPGSLTSQILPISLCAASISLSLGQFPIHPPTISPNVASSGKLFLT